ncbi:MAG: ABC1 kinase family protein [Nanobdellota archaeon]
MGLVKEIKDLGRLKQVISVAVKYEMGFLVDHLKIKHLLPIHQRMDKSRFRKEKTEPEALRKIFEELGGAFLKLGQLLSLRPDLIPAEYCEEFRRLQDNVKPFDDAGENIDVKGFSYINPRPLASASISQVHEAILNNNEKVAVKIKRPGIDKLFEKDIDILYKIAKHFKKKAEGLFDPVEVVREFERYTINELDFLKEAKNIEKFSRNFEEDENIKIPKVYWKQTSSSVLTMEFIHGQNIEKYKDKNEPVRKNITSRVANMVFKQIFEDGFFHADPHPGNIFVMKKGKIALLDFGIVGEIDEETKEKLNNLFTSLISADVDNVAETMISLNFAGKRVDRKELKNDLKDLLGEYYNTSLSKIDIGMLFHKAIRISRRNGMHVPSDLVLLGKSLITVEGFCSELDPDFNIVEAFKPTKQDVVKSGLKSVMRFKDFIMSVPERVEYLTQAISDNDKSMDQIDRDLKDLNTNINRSVSIIALTFLVIGFLVFSILTLDVGEAVFRGLSLMSLIGLILAFVFLMILLHRIFRG